MSSRGTADRVLPWFVFGVFVVLTILATYYVWDTTRSADRARFDNAVQTTNDAIAARLGTYVNVLTGTRGLVVADPTLPRDSLRAYIRSLNVARRYPGIQGVGVAVRIPVSSIPELEAEMRRGGYPRFQVWPMAAREEAMPIVLLEPQDRRNAAAMGYDMWSEPLRRDAMMRARDSGRPAATPPVVLVQEIEAPKQKGFIIYTPLYATGTTPPTLEQRRDALVGFIYAPFRAADLLEGIFGTQERPEVGFTIHDRGELLYATPGLPANPRFTEVRREHVAGRVWTIRWISRREGKGLALLSAAGTFAGGMVIAFLLFSLIRVQMRAREQAEATTERLRTSEAALQRANVAKDEFLATLSHELRTPMTAILGWSQMLGEEDLDDASRAMAVEAIRKSATVQAQLIDDLLDVSRITAGKMKIEPEPIELAPVVESAIDTVRSAAEAKSVSISSNVATGIWVNGDERRLQQVTWNLLTNAVKFTPEGGQVFVELREEGSAAVVEVRDTGQGIDPAFMPHVFERFRQADSSTTRPHMGLGLGLAIVRHLVELHGGNISAESKGEGRGSTFRVRLPLLRNGRTRREEEPEPIAEDALHGLRVLVVDDDEEVRNFVTTVFRNAGAEVRNAPAARPALDVLAEWPADVVLSDLAMPGADGFDLLHWIRASHLERVRTLPVVALTAFAMPEDRQRVMEGGFQGFVAKPVEPARLREAIWTAATKRPVSSR
ncbi:MAG TPA: CHASE domain-containing protein [Thermoanaerobaculia bacterium]|jgi:signal transduction histidine kinase/ActR/RegA family two-component response regulator